MILKLSNLLVFILIPLFASSQLELGIFSETGGSLFNKKKNNDLPLLITYDDNANDVAFYPTKWNVINQVGIGAYMNIRVPQFKFYFGMNIHYKVMDLEFKGYSDYTNDFYIEKYGTYDQFNTAHGGNVSLERYDEFIDSVHFTNQYPFKIIANRSEFSMFEFNFGYKFNTYKTWRPYVQVSPFLIMTDIQRVSYAETKHPGFDVLPDFKYNIIMGSQLFGLRNTIGTEWRNLKFYGTLSFPINKEKLFDPEGVSLPYTWYLQYDFGIALRFATNFLKKSAPASGGKVVAKTTKNYTLTSRRAHRFDFGIVSSLLLGGPDINANGFTLFSMDTVREVFPNYSRNRVHLYVTNFSGVEALGNAGFGVYFGVIHKFISLQLEALYRPVHFIVETSDYKMDMLQNPYSPNIYNIDKSSYSSSFETTFDIRYHSIPVKLNLVLGNPKGFRFYGGFNWNYYINSKRFDTDKNTNNSKVYSDFHKLLLGQETDANFAGSYLSQSEVDIYPSQTEMSNYFKAPEQYFESFTNTTFTDKNPMNVSLGYHFGFGYTSGRISVRILAHNVFHWKGRTFYEGGELMDVSLIYMIFGK